MVKAVIFDMDGLMIDSERVTCEGYAVSLEKRGYESSLEFYKTTLGTNSKTTVELYKKQYGDDIPFYDILNEVHKYIEHEFETKGVPIKEGLIELLQYLKENNYKIILATSSDRQRVDKIFKQAHLFQYFDDYVCGNEVKNGKPDPEIFLTACNKLKVEPYEALVLEDSEAGIEAATRAHIPVICVPDMKYPKKEYAIKCKSIEKSLVDVFNKFKGGK